MYLTEVKEKFIRICPETFHKALNISMTGAVYGEYGYSLQKAYSVMTRKDYEKEDCSRINLNANQFPPMKRLIHHIITTIIYPKGGSRDQVTAIHKFIFFCLFHDVSFSLPHLMTNNNNNNNNNNSLSPKLIGVGYMDSLSPFRTILDYLFRNIKIFHIVLYYSPPS